MECSDEGSGRRHQKKKKRVGNKTAALAHYQRALIHTGDKIGDGQSAWNLGYMHEHGEGGLAQNFTRAADLYSMCKTLDPLGKWPGYLAVAGLRVRVAVRWVRSAVRAAAVALTVTAFGWW